MKFYFLLMPAMLLPGAIPAGKTSLPICDYTVKNSYPHDIGAFTQGLFYAEGHLFESTGLTGHSTIRKVSLNDGKIVKKVAIPKTLFGEGIVNWGSEILSVTWRSGRGFRWDSDTFEQTGEFSYSGEGWGLTQDGKSIILSDGTPDLRFLDPKTMTAWKNVRVTAGGQPVIRLNELEWVEGELFANIWLTDKIARIDPASGNVTGWLDLADLRTHAGGQIDPKNVLNGIAYDEEGQRLFVTGKNWPRMFEIELALSC